MSTPAVAPHREQASAARRNSANWTEGSRLGHPIPDIAAPFTEATSRSSIEGQGCSVLIVIHAREIVPGIYVSRPSKEKFLEGL